VGKAEFEAQKAKKDALKEEIARLERLERVTGSSGAIPNTPKRQLLDVREVIEKHPDKRVKWVNEGVPDKVMSRKQQGYEKLPESEGGRRVGNLALYTLPRGVYEGRVKAQETENKARLDAYKSDVQQAAESVARELRDRHGIKVDPNRILIEE
jgi:hypothetical protein